MRSLIEVLIYQYKSKHNLDVYTALNRYQIIELVAQITNCVNRIEYKTKAIDKERAK